MSLIVKKRIRDRLCHSIYRFTKYNNKYVIIYDKNKESSYLKCCGANSLHGLLMSLKSLVNRFQVDWRSF